MKFLKIGINENDNFRQMSVWNIFEDMNFYPVTPAQDVYSYLHGQCTIPGSGCSAIVT